MAIDFFDKGSNRESRVFTPKQSSIACQNNKPKPQMLMRKVVDYKW